MNNKLSVLLSCMHQEDASIVDKSNIKCDTIIVNQTDNDKEQSLIRNNQKIKFISSSQRGLSRSRNLALDNCQSEYALICDDDEVFVDNLEELIIDAFAQYNDDILIFNFTDRDKGLGTNYKHLNKLMLLKVSSWQIAFKVASIKNTKLNFDTKLGAGTPNGAGEENMFLISALKKGLTIGYVPEIIGKVAQEDSTWFNGYNREYFYKRGITTRYILGYILASIYGLHFLIKKRNLYQDLTSFPDAFCSFFKGFLFGKLQ